MFWYLREKKDSAREKMKEVSRMVLDGRFDKLSDEDKVSLAKQMTYWNNARGRYLYEPNEKARLWFLQPVFIKWIFGGNRSGKTASSAIDVIMQCEGWHPLQKSNLERLAEEAIEDGDWVYNPLWYGGKHFTVRNWCKRLYEDRLWIRSVPIEARCVSVDFPNGVEKFTGPAVRDWITKEEVKSDQISNDKKRKLSWKNGSVLEFMSHDQDLDAHGGTSRDVIWFDEEPPSAHFQENLMRVINGGRLIGGMTAVNGITWTQDQIWEKQHKYGDKNIYAIEMSTYENPILTEKAIKRIESQCLDEEEVDIRLRGRRVARGGLVWKEYKPRFPWLIEPFEIPKEEGMLLLAIDPHLKTEHAALWMWVDYKGGIELVDGRKTLDLKDGKPNLYLVAELFENGTIPDFSRDLRFVEMDIKRQHDVALCDPSAWIGDQRDDNTRTTVEQFEEEGITPIKGSKDLTGGIHKVRQLYKCDDTREGDHPRLMIFKSLKRTIWENSKYRYPDSRRTRARDEHAPIERPLDKDDHMMENKRRLVEYVWDYNFEIYEPPPMESIFYRGQKIDINFEPEIEEVYEITDANVG